MMNYRCWRCGQPYDTGGAASHRCPLEYGAAGAALRITGTFPVTATLAPPTEPVCHIYPDGRVEWKEGMTTEQKLDALAQMMAGRLPRIAPERSEG